jgi:hypothetical protein
LSRALTLQYDKVIFILEPVEQARAAIGKRVTVVDYPDGRLSIRHKGVEFAYRTFDKLRHVPQAAIIENKRLGAALAFIREQQIERAEAPRPPAARPPPTVTFLNGRNSDISIWWTHRCDFASSSSSEPPLELRRAVEISTSDSARTPPGHPIIERGAAGGSPHH